MQTEQGLFQHEFQPTCESLINENELNDLSIKLDEEDARLSRATGLTSVAFLDGFVEYGEPVTADIVRRAYGSWERHDDFEEGDLELLKKYVEREVECSPN